MPLTARRRLAFSASILPIASEAVAPSLAAQTRLQRPGRVVQPGVDDTRVVAALVASQFRLFLKDGQAEARLRFEQTVRRRKSDQPASDDGDVVASRRFGPHVLGL
jgi:hypothetical protein